LEALHLGLLKEACSFLKKRTKKLLSAYGVAIPGAIRKSLFASFSSEKEGLPYAFLS
jgi:hypothetical protein